MKAFAGASVAVTAIVVVVVAGCASACPAALITGSLAQSGSELILVPDGGGAAEQVIWPSGYSVKTVGGRLALVDSGGSIVATSGDHAALPGGEITKPGVWTVCGPPRVGFRKPAGDGWLIA